MITKREMIELVEDLKRRIDELETENTNRKSEINSLTEVVEWKVDA